MTFRETTKYIKGDIGEIELRKHTVHYDFGHGKMSAITTGTKSFREPCLT